jgi:hypothetical protein
MKKSYPFDELGEKACVACGTEWNIEISFTEEEK